ncbi:MAG: Gp19/Gp15/Gp42 family protein [Mycolicibacter algericus]|uniref:Gp19/Gp15/Gp42 family protein n=1 Tax=Mycolicibacter algericus TaxID=1288388 RepID=UPI003C7077EE
MAYAQTADVAARWGRTELTPEETAMANLRLAEAERMIRRRVPGLDSKVTDGDIDAADVVQIEADAVLRYMRNPEGYLSETDGNYTYMLQQGATPGRVSILPEEWAVLGVRATGMAVLAPAFGGTA